MAERDNDRGSLETFALAGLGALALVAERAGGLADELADRFGIDRDEVRAVLGDVVETWRREAQRIGDTTGDAAARVATELGVAQQDALDELRLRVAQLEHRLKLLERPE